MEDPEPSGKRLPAKGSRLAAGERRDNQESAPERRDAHKRAPKPGPRPVPSSPSKKGPLSGVPMARKEKAPEVKAGAKSPTGAPPASKKAKGPEDESWWDDDWEKELEAKPGADPGADELEEPEEPDLDLEVEDEAELPETPSRIYSTRRALAEQVNEEVAQHPYEEEAKGMAAIRGKRQAWKREVQEREQEGRSPYIIRWAKVSFMPFLYMLISLQLLRKIMFEYGEYYDYTNFYMIVGLGVGAITVLLSSSINMVRAKNSKRPIRLGGGGTWVAVVVFIGISVFLAWSYGLAYAWQFSIGFLAAGLLVVVVGFSIEKISKGTFWVKETTGKTQGRWLEFIPVSSEGS